MKNEEILLGVLIIAVIAAAAYIVLMQPAPTQESPEELELLKKSVLATSGHDDYYYAYEEIQNGYGVEYVLLQKDGERMLEISNPIADKTVYFLDDDTIMCEYFAGYEICSSVENNTDSYFVSYLNSLDYLFFRDADAQKEAEKLDYFYEKGYLKFKGMGNKAVDGKPCKELLYELDYTNISLADANKYGIHPASPKYFDFSVCIDENSGLAYARNLTYLYDGEKWRTSFKLHEAEFNTTRAINPPAELSEGAYAALLEEKGWFAQYQQCKGYSDESEESCISDLGTLLKSKKVCEMAGSWRDRCLLTVVALTGDGGICPTISDMDYRDDCYIEMAYYHKDESYCAHVLNVSKKETCIEAANYLPNVTSNESIEIVNPAAVNCQEQEYDYEIRTDNETEGEYGVCMYGGLECEEWALYHEECCITDDDCTRAVCINQTCVYNETVDMEEFLNYMEIEENETVSENETNSTESP